MTRAVRRAPGRPSIASQRRKPARKPTVREVKALAALLERQKNGAPAITLDELPVYRRLQELGLVTIQIFCAPGDGFQLHLHSMRRLSKGRDHSISRAEWDGMSGAERDRHAAEQEALSRKRWLTEAALMLLHRLVLAEKSIIFLDAEDRVIVKPLVRRKLVSLTGEDSRTRARLTEAGSKFWKEQSS